MVEVIEIVILTYSIIEVLKRIRNFKSEDIPAIACVIGGCLGVVCFFYLPEYPANNCITAVAVGIVSGMASTGSHQIIKQFNKKKGEQ